MLLNALVVGLNGAMPVSAEALGQARLSTQDLLAGNDPRHELAGPDTHLRLIGDEIPVLLPVRPEVVSTGDVLIAAGLAQLIVTAMRRRPPLHPDYPALAPPDDQGGVGPEPEVGSLAGAVQRRHTMAKKGRKRRARKKSNANHGKRPNA